MVTVILSLLNTGLSLWLHKEKTKYIDEVREIEREYYAEINKPEDQRSDAVLDNLEWKLRSVARAFTAHVGEANA